MAAEQGGGRIMGSTHSSGHDYTDGSRGVDDESAVAKTIEEVINDRDAVDRSYEEFAEEVGITGRQGEMIAGRRDVIESILDDSLGVKDTQLMGSFTRGTMVGPLNADSDADMMVVLDANEHRDWIGQENGPSNALRAVKRRIKSDRRFSRTEVSIDQNVVQVKYNDSMMEISPAFDYSEVPRAEHPRSGFNLFNSANDGYAIPDTHGGDSWMGTNPRAYKNEFEARDQAHDGKVSGLTRMVKKWSEKNDVPIRSYHAEVMVHNHFAEKATTGETVPESYHDLTGEFMSSLPDRLSGTTKEPIYGEAVDGGLSDADRTEAIEKARTATATLDEAAKAKENGDVDLAKEKLREEYGEGFNAE